jgi:hypothetical protein
VAMLEFIAGLVLGWIVYEFVYPGVKDDDDNEDDDWNYR